MIILIWIGSSFDPHRTPASQVRATAASIFVELTEKTTNEGVTKVKLEKTGNKSQGVPESSPTDTGTASDDLPFLQIQSKGTRPSTNLPECEQKADNVGSLVPAVPANAITTIANTGSIVGEKHGPQDRFKVVKIETVVAKEVGRWTLVDYANRSAPVMPSNPTYFPAHISPAMSLTSTGKLPLKSALKSSSSKPSIQPAQNQAGQLTNQSVNQNNVPITVNQQTKVRDIPGVDTMKIIGVAKFDPHCATTPITV